jgi:hypothetical protein
MKSKEIFPVLVLMIFAFTLVCFSVTAVNFAGYLLDKAPAVVSITTITNSGCADCENLASVVSSVKGAKTRVNSEKTLSLGSAEAAALIQKYSIQKLPALVVEGQAGKLSLSGFTAKEGALVYETATVPYSEASGNVRGNIEVTYVTAPSCSECYTAETYRYFVSQFGFYLSSEEIVPINSSEGIALRSEYQLANVPTIIFRGDLEVYPEQYAYLSQNSAEVGDAIILKTQPPYLELSSGRVRGLATITYLNDSTCTDCYDVTIHGGVSQIGIYLDEEKFVDVNSVEGRALVAKYNITSAPTMLLSGDLSVYTGLEDIWVNQLRLGTLESDGTYVFRAMSLLGDMKYVELN